MGRVKVGVQLHPQNTSMDALCAAAVDAEEAGADSVWLWDHFFPIYGDPGGAHFEAWTTLTAFACDTEDVQIGTLVTCHAYRNPDLLADMARTVDHLAKGRLVLGLGAGWYERDYEAYGFDYKEAPERLADLEDSLERIEARLEKLTPPPVGDLPILIGGGGEEITLRIVAQHADLWNGFADSFDHKNQVLDQWCDKVDRDPREIERTVLINEDYAAQAPGLVDQGAQHLILGLEYPYDLGALDAVRAAVR